MVDRIVVELAQEPRIRKLYDLWYEQREEVLRTYTDNLPERIPLEQNKEFKAICNAVIQEAMKISQAQTMVQDIPREPCREAIPEPVPEVFQVPEHVRFRTELQQEEPSEAENTGADEAPDQPNAPTNHPITEPSAELNTMAMSASVSLLSHLSRMIRNSAREQEQTRKPRQDHVLQRQQDEKKQALGIRD